MCRTHRFFFFFLFLLLLFFQGHCHIFRFGNLFDITYQLFNSSAVILSKRCPAMPGMISNTKLPNIYIVCLVQKVLLTICFSEILRWGRSCKWLMQKHQLKHVDAGVHCSLTVNKIDTFLLLPLYVYSKRWNKLYIKGLPWQYDDSNTF